jgi:hypothetical protein
MTHLDFDPELERLGDALHASTADDLAREQRAARPGVAEQGRRADPVPAMRARRTRPRRRLVAGGTLGLAAVGAALTLALGAASSPPAFAVTRNDDGSVTVQINELQALPQANAKLTAMGIREQVSIYMAAGPAAVSGPVSCSAAPSANLPGPPLNVLVGKDGTEVISAGQSAGNTGEGTWHLDHCVVMGGSGSGNSGNTGAG